MAFEKKDFQRFLLYLNSPFFNTNSLLSDLFEQIIKNKEKSNFEIKLSAFKKNNKISDTKFIKYINDLHKHFENYIAYTLQENNQIKKYLDLLDLFLEKNDFKTFNYYYTKTKNLLKKVQKKDENYYAEQLRLNIIYYDFLTTKNNRVLEGNLAANLETLDKYYWIQKLKLTLYQYNKAKILNVNKDDDALNEILLKVAELKKLNNPYISIYSEMLLLTHNKEKESHYNNLLELLKNNQNEINETDLRNIYITLTNSIIRVFSGKKIYSEMFQINIEKIKVGAHKINNIVMPPDFTNIITCALGIDKYEWAKEFIKEEGKFLPKEVKEDYLLFNNARCAFYKKDFDSCLSLLACCKPTDVIFKTKIKRLYLKTSFELKDYSLFENTFHSFKMFLIRDKELTKKNNKANTDFLSIINKLFKLSLVQKENNQKKLEKLEVQTKEKRMPEKKWLLEKINVIKK